MYDLTRKPLYAQLTELEVNESIAFVESMRKDKVAHSVVDQMYDRKNTSEGINLLGHMGEVACAKVLGVPVDREVRTGGDEGYDLMFNHLTVQVKTSTLNKLLFNSPDKFSARVGILVQYLGKDRQNPQQDPRFCVWGWVSREEFLSRHTTHNYGYGERLVLGVPYLKALNSLQRFH